MPTGQKNVIEIIERISVGEEFLELECKVKIHCWACTYSFAQWRVLSAVLFYTALKKLATNQAEF